METVGSLRTEQLSALIGRALGMESAGSRGRSDQSERSQMCGERRFLRFDRPFCRRGGPIRSKRRRLHSWVSPQ